MSRPRARPARIVIGASASQSQPGSVSTFRRHSSERGERPRARSSATMGPCTPITPAATAAFRRAVASL